MKAYGFESTRALRNLGFYRDYTGVKGIGN